MFNIDTSDLQDKTIVLPLFNSIVNLWYTDKKKTNPHRDQQHTPNGDFYYAMNSQVESTAVAILVIGYARKLEFELYRNYDRTDPGDIERRPGTVRVMGQGTTKTYQLKHGTLFLLHPNDEKTVLRSFFKKLDSRKTFVKHSSTGVYLAKDGLSIGLVFRTVNVWKEVDIETGKVVMSPELEREVSSVTRKRKRVLDDPTKVT